MKLLDKLKNIFFEEVEDTDEEEIPQTFAKKVEIPKKREEIKVKQELPPKEEKEFDFIKEELPKEEKKEEIKPFPMMFDEDDFFEDIEDNKRDIRDEVSNEVSPLNLKENHELDETKELYVGKKEIEKEKPVYTYTRTVYEEEKTRGFKPSPIISPIYGILDKNYHKEEVVTKRETRITSTYGKPDLDSVRNKAFGNEEEDTVTKPKKDTKVASYAKEEKKIYDVNKSKPQVSGVTLADADEYYNDLGLAYNVDYSDASKNNTTRTSKYNQKEKKKETNKSDDNLFDLIDSMYNKED